MWKMSRCDGRLMVNVVLSLKNSSCFIYLASLACLLNSYLSYANYCLTQFSDVKHSFSGLLQLFPAAFS